MARVESTNQNKCYRPSEDLINLMTGLHRYELDKVKLEKDFADKILSGREAAKEKVILKNRKRALDVMKVRVLNEVVFPSMANLTRFLELILVSPYTNRVFEPDLKALFLVNSETSENKKAIFARFIEACCWSRTSVGISKRGKVKPQAPLSDSRLILMEIMMDAIWERLAIIGESRFKNDTFLNTVLYADFGRAVAWWREFANEAHVDLQRRQRDTRKNTRPAMF